MLRSMDRTAIELREKIAPASCLPERNLQSKVVRFKKELIRSSGPYDLESQEIEISKDNLKLLSSRMRAELADRILTLNYSSGRNSPIIARMNIATEMLTSTREAYIPLRSFPHRATRARPTNGSKRGLTNGPQGLRYFAEVDDRY